ncbi:MAG: protein kinase domain-containing protein [Pyrinomonadaceae bacterium]
MTMTTTALTSLPRQHSRQNVAASPASSLGDGWRGLCEQFLPVTPADSIWRYSRHWSPADPEQGWKLHLSATVLTANQLLGRVAPFLSGRGVLFKAPSSLHELGRINSGLHQGFSQVGKVITVYPQSPREAVTLAGKLHQLTYGLSAPKIPFDLQFQRNSCIYYRYGGFVSVEMEDEGGNRVSAVRNAEGKLVPDLRGPGKSVPAWVADPFPQKNRRRKQARVIESLLRTTFRAYKTISQRGKGGVYRALDLSLGTQRFCVLKEGRPHGETDWDGRDGCWRVRHEEHVLSCLSAEGIRVPEVYASFEVEGHYYLVTEFIEGDNLHSLLLNKKRLPITEALRYGMQLAELLSGIHAAGWSWRDCKPLNLIVAEEGFLRPVDFEGACRVDAPDPAPWSTLVYTPPEQHGGFTGESCVSQDLYALGVTLHQVFSGQVPDPSKRLAPIGRLRRGIPPAVRKVIAALLQPRPQSRPKAQTVFEKLRRAYAELA